MPLFTLFLLKNGQTVLKFLSKPILLLLKFKNINYLIRLKGEIERLEVEYNENLSKEQARYNLEINKLNDQIFENEVIQKTLEKEVCYFIFLEYVIYI